METKTLTAADILGSDDLKKAKVNVPEWGGIVYVRMLTGAERDRWESSVIQRAAEKRFEHMRAELVSMTVCDAEGKLIFTADQVEQLSHKAGAPLQKLFNIAQALNKVSKSDIKELEDFS